MKKHFLSVFFICGLIALTVSCAKDDPEEDKTDTSTSVNSSSSLTAEVNGTAFPVNLMNVSMLNQTLQFIAGHSVTDRAIGLFFPFNIAPGTYPTDDNQYRITYTSAASQNNQYSAKNNGTIVIISNNVTSKIIKGTFVANATHTSAGAANDTIKITKGHFTIVY